MATAEFEELKLSVVLVDEASAGLTALRTEMRNFNDDSIRFVRNARDNAEAVKRVARETDDVVKGLRAKGAMLTRVGNAVGILTAAYYGTTTYLAKFALEVEQIANAAQLLGVTYADLRNVSEQMARKGLSPEMGGRILGAANALGTQLQSMAGVREWENSLRASKIALDPAQADAYIQALINARGWHERLLIVRNAANNLERNAIAAGKTKEEAAILREEFFVKQGFPRETALTGAIADTTEKQKEKWGRLQEGAQKWNEITHKIIKNVKTILEIMNADSMDPDGPFYAMLRIAVNVTGYIDQNLAQWITSITDAGAWLAEKFGGSAEPAEKPGGGSMETEGLMPPVEPMGFGDDDDPLRLEKLIKEFRAFHDNLRSGGAIGPSAPLEQYASLGSMATPGLQLPPAAAAGDIYTDKYPIWPGGGAKPTGSDVGPGSGLGAMGEGGPGNMKWPWGPEGRFRSAPRGRFTPGGIPLFPINRPGGGGGGGGAADGDDGPRGGRYEELPKVPGDFREPGGPRPPGDRSYSSTPYTPDYLASTQPSTNIQDVRGGSWGGAGGAGGTSQPPHLIPPGYASREKSVFVPGLDQPAPQYPPSTSTDPSEMTLGDLASQRFFLQRERQQFEPGSMRDLLQRNPNLYRRNAEYTARQIELRQERATEELNEPLAFPWRAPPGPRSGPGDIGPSGIPTDRGAFALDRSVLDRGMGNEMGGRLEGGIGLNVNVKGPPGTEATAEGSGIINQTTVDRETSFGAD